MLADWRGPADQHFRQLLAEVSVARRISIHRILVCGRKDTAARSARALIALSLREVYRHSFPEIAQAIGLEAHSTVIRMLRHIPVEVVQRFKARGIEVKPAPAPRTPPTPSEERIAGKAAVAHAEGVLATFKYIDGREAFGRARLAYWSAPQKKRQQVWTIFCREMFPVTWKAQAAMPPGTIVELRRMEG